MGLKIKLFLLFFVFVQTMYAQEKEAESSKSVFSKLKFWEEDTVSKKEGFFILPLLYYTPDTRFAFGAAGVYYFNTAKNGAKEDVHPTRLSYVKLLGDYTQNNQLDVWSDWTIFTNEEKWLIKGEARYRNFPDSYYGIGNDSEESNREKYAYDYYSLKLLGMKRIGQSSFVGLDYVFENEYNFTYDELNSPLSGGEVVGSNGGIGSAIGSVFLFDSRDNVINAYEGQYFQFSSYFFCPELGSSFDFVNINAVYNAYRQVRSKHILAFNVVTQFNFGDVPFLDMAKVGNDDILRGYPRNRYRDNHFVATQAEYRFPVYKRLGAVAFLGLGDVFSNTNELRIDYLKYSYGGGARFTINRNERLNVRLDYGVGRNESSFYFTVTESF